MTIIAALQKQQQTGSLLTHQPHPKNPKLLSRSEPTLANSLVTLGLCCIIGVLNYALTLQLVENACIGTGVKAKGTISTEKVPSLLELHH